MDGIESDVAGRALVLRVDLLSAEGGAIAARYGVQFTPTFMLFDRGRVVETLRTLDRAATAARLLALAR